MRAPRLSIAAIMGAVVILAVDFALYRETFQKLPHRTLLLILGVAPMANLVLASTIAEALRVGRHGAGCPFRTGFALVGGLAMLLTTTYIITVKNIYDYMVIVRTARFLIEPVTHNQSMSPDLLTSVILILLTLPQLILATLGGLLFRRFRLAIARLSGAEEER